jgi:hydrogenase-4 component B
MLDSYLRAPELACASLALFGVAGVFGLMRPTSRFGVPGVLCLFASGMCLLAALAGTEGSLVLTPTIGLAGVEVSFRVDGLSRWFLGLIGVVGLAIGAYLPGYLLHLRGRAQPGLVCSGLAVLFASMVGVVTAGNAVVFFAFWELMAVSSFLLVATEHERGAVRRAAFIYLGATRLGSAFLVAGFFWMYAVTGSWLFSDWSVQGAAASGPAALILVGLLTKAGSWPFHLWLPIAHPAAPGPVSAVMSGVMIKTAIYAVVRVFVLGEVGAPWIGWSLIVAGAVSAIWGILFALLQSDLKRLLAYSSVENVGFILLALGVSLIAGRNGILHVSELALGAALFHVLNHGVFKSLLFLGAGTVDANAHTREMDRLGGLAHKMPWTAATFFVGSASICALAPLSGFASEWLLYKGLFQMGASAASGELRLAGLLLLGWVGLVGALALACFTKAFGISFLGRARSGEADHAKEGTTGMVVACVFLAALCIGLGIGAPWVWGAMGGLGLVATAQAWTLPVVPTVVAGTIVLLALWATMHALAKKRPLRTYVTWDCGFGPLSARTQYTATSFVQPVARLFGALYRYETEVVVEGQQRRHFPTEVRAESRHEVYLESRVYSPGLNFVLRISEGFIMRLQAGSIHQYLLFMVLTLVLLLWLGGVL